MDSLTHCLGMRPPVRGSHPAVNEPSDPPRSPAPSATLSTATTQAVTDPGFLTSGIMMTSQQGGGFSTKPLSSEDLAPHTTLAQLSYAPATQTTVVTTTTTTTTSLPPLIMQAPRHLSELDPKQYPLALSKTPQSLRNISFEYNGVATRLFEADDASRSLKKVSQPPQIAALGLL
jgi:hypothetical protein